MTMPTQLATDSLLIASGDATAEEARREADIHAAEAGRRITHLIRHTREDDLDWYEYATVSTSKREAQRIGAEYSMLRGGPHQGSKPPCVCSNEDADSGEHAESCPHRWMTAEFEAAWVYGNTDRF